MILFSALHWNYYPVLWRVTQVLLDISAHYPWAMGVLLGDVHLSEQERLNNLVPQRGLNFRPSDFQYKTLHTQPFGYHLLYHYLVIILTFVNIGSKSQLSHVILNSRWLFIFVLFVQIFSIILNVLKGSPVISLTITNDNQVITSFLIIIIY